MLDRYIIQGRADALRRFGFSKLAMALGPAGPATAEAAAMASAAPTGFMGKAKAFGQGQWGAAKELAGNLHQGLGGAASPELGQAARGAAVGNLKTLAPSLLAGGALYMAHRHSQGQREQNDAQGVAPYGGMHSGVFNVP